MNYKSHYNVYKQKYLALLAATALTATSLSGCSNEPKKESYKRALIFNREQNQVCVMEFDNCFFSNSGLVRIILKDGTVISSSSIDTKLINSRNNSITAEELAKSICGEDVEIIYLTPNQELTLNRK